MRIGIGVRLVGLGVCGVFAVVAVAGVTMVASTRQASSSERMAVVSDAMSAQWNADMMHDGIRADVMAALYARDDAARAAYGVDEVQEKADVMLDAFDRAAAGAPDGIRAAMEKTRPDVVAYTGAGVDLVGLAGSDRAAATAALPDFLDLFGSLEEQLGAIDEALEGAVGDVEVVSSQDAARTIWAVVIVTLLALAGLGTLSLLLARTITRSVRRVVDALNRLAARDLTVHIEDHSNDELGDMGRALNSAVAELRGTIGETGRSVEHLTTSSVELNDISVRLGRSAEQTSTQADGVAEAASSVSGAAGAMAAATNQMEQSIREISERAANAARVATEAVESVERTTHTVDRLSSASQEIGGILRTISAIAEQTNMLALNATIEAARAGEAGKGFAVVATEVKELAHQTASATEDISSKISSIQDMTGEATQAIQAISEVIGRIHENQAMIAAAVEEQSATTAEISHAVHDVSGRAQDIAGGAGSIAGATESAVQGADEAHHAAERLGEVAARVSGLVGQFVC